MAKKKPGPISLTQSVLNQASQQELQSFFQWYLRNDVKAQLQFLARFSDKIPVDESERYEWVFYKSIQMLRGGAVHLGINKQKVLIRIFRELYRQAADALAINHYVKTFFICTNGITFIRLLKTKERTLHKEFFLIFDDYLELLHEFYLSDIPRELIQRLIDFVDKEVYTSRHVPQKAEFSLQRLKIRLEYYHNGIEALFQFIQINYSLKALKSIDELSTFYYSLLTEPWIQNEISHLKRLSIPREIWKSVLFKLEREGNQSLISELWDTFTLHSLLGSKKTTAQQNVTSQQTIVDEN